MENKEILKITNIQRERSNEGGDLDVWSFSIFLGNKKKKDINSVENKNLFPGERRLFAITYEALHYDPNNKTLNGDINIWQESIIEKFRTGKIRIDKDFPLYVEATEGYAKKSLEEFFLKRYSL